jgi:hypothetical protein
MNQKTGEINVFLWFLDNFLNKNLIFFPERYIQKFLIKFVNAILPY